MFVAALGWQVTHGRSMASPLPPTLATMANVSTGTELTSPRTRLTPAPLAAVAVASAAPIPTIAYYVATTGNDANSCAAAQDINTPKRTINNAVYCLTPGSTLYIRTGTYPEQLWDAIPSGTSWSQPVIVAAYSGETVILQPLVGASRVLHFQNSHQYIVIDGLILDGINIVDEVVKITYGSDPATSAHHIRIQNSEIKNGPVNAILVGGNTGYNEFINNKVHDNGTTDFEHGIYVANNNNLIEGSEFYRNSGWGIHLFGGGPSYNIVRNNRVHDNARVGNRGPGIGIYGWGNLVYNNVVWGNAEGIQLDGGGDNELYNNTIYGNNSARGCHCGIALGSTSNTIVKNNIVYQNDGSAISGDSGLVQSNNLIDIDPHFLNAAALDFHLLSTSPAIDAGATVASVMTDADGVSRPQGQAHDIGAYEVVGQTSVPSLTITDISLAEGNAGTTNVVFPVTLSAASGQAVSVNYATADGTATIAGGDYVATSGVLTFPAGTTSQQVTVTVNGDTVSEPVETFVVNLSGAVNATLAKSQGVGTIQNDDSPPAPPGWWDSNWTNRRKITFDNRASSTALTDFPVLVTLDATTIDYTKTKAGGADIRFVDADIATALNYEIETWNAGGTSRVWVRVPQLDHTATDYIWLYYNNAAATDGQPPAAVWDPHFQAVWHLQESTGSNVSDSTSHANTLAQHASPTQGPAHIGGGLTFNGSTQYLDLASGLDFETVTVEAWLNGSDTCGCSSPLTHWDTTYPGKFPYELRWSEGTPQLLAYDGTRQPVSTWNGANLNGTGWHHVVGVRTKGGTLTIYVDGVAGPTVTDTTVGTTSNGARFGIGGRPTHGDFPGSIDEVRISNSARSADWIRAAYLSESNQMSTFGQEESGATTSITPSLTINDTSLAEGDAGTTNVVFPVTLSAASDQAVSVNYATADGTATSAGGDYVATSGVLTFPAGTTSQSITVQGNGDLLHEPTETFVVNLSGATNATLAKAQGVGTIQNDDPLPSLTISDVSLAEGDAGTANVVFSVTLLPARTKSVTVNYATANGTATVADGDYVATSGVLTFPAGTTSQPITVKLNGDLRSEPNETFVVNLSGATNATLAKSQGIGTILNDDGSPSLTISDVSRAEGKRRTTNFVFTVTLSAASSQVVSVNYATANGTATVAGRDYRATSGVLTVSAGTTSRSITVKVNGDRIIEPNETFVVNLSSAVNATLAKSQGIGTILNDDGSPSLTISDVSLPEGNAGTANVVFSVTLSPTREKTVTVNYATADGTATVAGADYIGTSGVLTFPAGTTGQSITVQGNGDLLHEPNETLVVTLSGATNASVSNSQGVGTIQNDDPLPSLTITDISLAEGDVGTTNVVFPVTLSAASGQAVTVNYATADGTATIAGGDYVATSGVLTFPAGTTSQSITVQGNGDLLHEPNETLVVTLSGATNASVSNSQGVGTIQNDDPLPSLTITDISLAEGDVGTTNVVFPVTLSAVSGQAVSVNYATADGTATIAGGDYVATSGVLSFPAGTTSQSITVQGNGDLLAEPNETFVVTLSGAVNATGTTSQGLGTILNDDASAPTGGAWWDPSWTARRKITFDNRASSTALTNFPVLVTLDSTTIDYTKTKAGGADIRFVDADNATALNHEIETWNAGGTSRVWVQVPQLDHTATDHIWLYYNNAAATDGQTPAAVWDPHFQAVWHLKESTGSHVSDSTSHANTLTPHASPTQGPAHIGGGVTFNGSTQYLDLQSGLDFETVTVEAWLKSSDTCGCSSPLTHWDTTYPGKFPYELRWFRGTPQLLAYDGTRQPVSTWNGANLNGTGWHHVVGVRTKGGTLTIYVDGVAGPTVTDTTVGTTSNGARFGIGGRPTQGDFPGSIDEVRISNVARSADWIQAEYQTMTGTMNTFAPEEEVSGTAADGSYSFPTPGLNKPPPGVGLNVSHPLAAGMLVAVHFNTGSTPLNLARADMSGPLVGTPTLDTLDGGSISNASNTTYYRIPDSGGLMDFGAAPFSVEVDIQPTAGDFTIRSAGGSPIDRGEYGEAGWNIHTAGGKDVQIELNHGGSASTAYRASGSLAEGVFARTLNLESVPVG